MTALERRPARSDPAPANPPWHARTAEEVARGLGVDVEAGLDPEEAAARLRVHGPNRLTPARRRGPLARLAMQFHQPLVYILLVATALSLFLREWVDAAVIFGVVLVNALVGFVQESRAVRAIEALSRSMTHEATVVRGGQRRRIDAAEVVPGDLVQVASGDKVPADVRLLSVRDLQVDESALTGESVPVDKATEPVPAETELADRRDMAYSSALVTHGQGQGVVVATGDRTEIGRISELIETAEHLATPLTRRIAAFSRVLVWVILGLTVLTLVAGVATGRPLLGMFNAAIALAVAAIPEGLPAAVTIMLAIGVSRMARRRAVVRRLPAVETLGSTTVICSDKTGTLTKNQMTVRVVVAGGQRVEVTGAGYAPQGRLLLDGRPVGPDDNAALRECLLAGVLCNDSALVRENGRWTVQGDPTEGALLVAGAKAGIDPERAWRDRPRIDALPFESEHQYMATLHEAGPDGARVVYVKGSTERVARMCDRAMGADDGEGPLDAGAVQRAAEELASEGLRVLALARGEVPHGTGRVGLCDVEGGLVFLGLQAMIDPPRPEAVEAVARCRAAGIAVKMITGDHAGTALAIARQLGLGDDGARAVTGRELEAAAAEDLPALAERAAVFARVAPEQKLRLVRALQRRGHVVAMTGDGVNDAPALRQADIGIAMGRSGTEVAREAADMVLTDDNFASIEAAVQEGRGVYDNLMKFIVWTLPTNMGEGMVILASILLGATLPLLPVQVLWINLTTGIALGLTLAFEPREPDVMRRPPRDPRAPILGVALVMRILFVSLLILVGTFGLFEYELRRGASAAEARTVAVGMVILGETFYLINCRSLTRSVFEIGWFSNPWIWAGAALMVALQVAFTHAPVMNRLFHSEPIDAGAWGRIVAAGFLVFVAVGIEKEIRRRVARWRAGAARAGALSAARTP